MCGARPLPSPENVRGVEFSCSSFNNVTMPRPAEMTEFIAFVETTARDPLLGAFALMAIGVLISRLLLKQRPIWRAFARVVFLILLTLLLLHNDIVPYLPLYSTGTPVRNAVAAILKIAW